MGSQASGAEQARTVARGRWTADINAANVSAGITCGLWYVFGGLPIFLGTAAALHLSPTLTSSWLYITCLTGSLIGLFLTLRYRQPMAITMTIPGWVPLAFFGVGSAFWAPVGGLAVSALLERPGLRRSISGDAEVS